MKHFSSKQEVLSTFQLKFEIRELRSTFETHLSSIQLKLGKIKFLGVKKYKNDDDVKETK